jgi:hypothetical protein
MRAPHQQYASNHTTHQQSSAILEDFQLTIAMRLRELQDSVKLS